MKRAKDGYNAVTESPENRNYSQSSDTALDVKSSEGNRLRLVFTVNESAFALHVSQSTMWRMVYHRQIPSCKVRGRVMIRVKDLDRYLEQNMVKDYA